jgi:hypothetical protein
MIRAVLYIDPTLAADLSKKGGSIHWFAIMLTGAQQVYLA